jgi:hypothetical protein
MDLVDKDFIGTVLPLYSLVYIVAIINDSVKQSRTLTSSQSK